MVEKTVILSGIVVLLLHVKLILHHELGVCSLVLGPCSVFISNRNSFSFSVFNLLRTGGLDLSDLVWSESFEMVGHVAMAGMLTRCREAVFCHNVAVVCNADFIIILVGLLVLPVCFAVSLFLS